MATKRFCDIDGAEIRANDWTFDLDLSISIRPENDRINEPTIGGYLHTDYTLIRVNINDVCEGCARKIAVTIKDIKNESKNVPAAE